MRVLHRSLPRCSRPQLRSAKVRDMDLGSAFAAAVMRQPRQEAFVEGKRRMSYADWYRDIASVAGGLHDTGLREGDHLVVVMRNRYEMATLYWACQLLGIVFTPVSWRATADEISYCLEDAEAAAVAFDGASGAAAAEAAATLKIDPRRVILVADGKGEGMPFARLRDSPALAGPAAVSESATCLMLYTSGTTGRPKGVPRSHRSELMAAIAHIAQNQYRQGDSGLGVMPFFHTMGVRIMLSTALLNGRLVCVPEYGPEQVLRLISKERLTTLFLVPTMFHDVLRHPEFESYDLRSLSRVGFAGMTMSPTLIERGLDQLKPDLFVNYYGSSEIYTFSYCDHLDRKPGCAGRAGMNQIIRVAVARRRYRDRPGGGRRGRDRRQHAQPGGILGLLEAPRRRRQGDPRPLVPHRRSRKARRGWRALRRRPRRRHDHQRRRKHLSRGSGGHPRAQQARRGMRRRGNAGRAARRQGGGFRRTGGRRARARGARQCVPAEQPRPFQAPQAIRIREGHSPLRVRQASAPQVANRGI